MILAGNIFEETLVWDSVTIAYFLILIGFFLLGFYIIYKQVALVKKGEFNIRDGLQCLIYGLIFSMAVMIVMGMAFVFSIETPEFWENSPTPPPDLQPLILLIPFLTCFVYIAIYPLIDFLFIALSEESDEGLTPFHKFIGDRFINKSDKKPVRVIMAIISYLMISMPPLILWATIRIPFIMVLISWMLVYPLMILTFYGSKGYIAGISNVYYHLPDLKRSIFLGFEDGKRSMREFKDDPGPRILLGLMLFVFAWSWISMIQTVSFFFTGTMAVSTMSYTGMVFVTLLMGIIGYFTRFWGRKIKYRGIDIYFAAYLMAAVGINVLVNFLIVNPDKLANTFDFTLIGLHELIPNSRTFAFAAVIEEVVLIIFTSFYFLTKKNEFTGNIKYSSITQCGQTFDPIPLFNFIKSDIPRVRSYAQETLTLMFERIPYKDEIDLNKGKFKNSLMDGICDPNPYSSTTCYKILVQLENDIPELVLPWVIEALESPNYDKSIPIARSLLETELSMVERIPESIIFSLIEDSEWRLKLLGLQILSRLVKANNNTIMNLFQKKYLLNRLVNNPDSQIQVEILNILAETEVVLPISSIIDRINHSNKEIRAAAIKNMKNLSLDNVDSELVYKIIPLMKDSAGEVRASIFEVLAKFGNFRKLFVPVLPFLEGLTDSNANVRNASVLALEKYFDESPGSLDLDAIIDRIDPNDNEGLNSVLSLLGRLWIKDPEKIMTILLIFIKFDNDQLKENISKILIEKYSSSPDLIIENTITIPDVAKFITKGIIARTLIEIAKKDPQKVIPKLISYLDSDNDDVKLNAIVSLDGLIDNFSDMVKIKPILILLQSDQNQQIKKEASKIISKIAKKDPQSIKPVISIILQSLKSQEDSVKIVLSKSLLEIAKQSPKLLPIRPIIGFLSDKESFIRETGAKILGFISSNDVADEIVMALINEALVDEEWIVREAAVSSLGKIIHHVEDKQLIIMRLVSLLDDDQAWVRRSAMNILSNMEEVKASDLPFEKLSNSITDSDPKVREAAAGLIKIYRNMIDRIFDKIDILLEDESEEVRKSMINTMVDMIEHIGLDKVLSSLLKNLSDDGSMEAQRSTALILGRTTMYADEKIKKRVISLLKIRAEMSQDPIISEILNKLREN